MNLIEYVNPRLACDECDLTTPVASLSEDLIDTPCPRCGANMLTRENYDKAKELVDSIAKINAGSGPVSLLRRLFANRHRITITIKTTAKGTSPI